MTTRTLRQVIALFAAGSVLATGLFAQNPAPKLEFPQPSPAATLKQRVGITDITVEYSRPSLKGRKAFGPGGLEPYGAVWRTGANNATKITFSTDVKFGGKDVPAGTYSLFSIPGENEWTVILNSASGWGSYGYDQSKDVARVTVKPVTLSNPLETFSIGFSNLRPTAATFYLSWEKARVPVEIEVDVIAKLQPQIESVMASDAKDKPYFGAAMFYYENNLDLNKAAEWVDAGLAAQPNAFWMHYRKGLILAKKGDKAGALAAAQKSKELALGSNQPQSLKDEYVRLNDTLIASLK
ncbi:MAG TPA: DUF2911 domain-containing protein [Opitutaceae bacterium]|nr:DUF2911 domain-containing protein [Opitutaceae bacterium]